MEQQPQENPVPLEQLRDPEAQLGGADAVQKTTYVLGEGTDPDARNREGVLASGASRGAPTFVLVIVVVLAVLVALAYAIGAGR